MNYQVLFHENRVIKQNLKGELTEIFFFTSGIWEIFTSDGIHIAFVQTLVATMSALWVSPQLILIESKNFLLEVKHSKGITTIISIF
jgi:hypothetical protein